MVGTRYPASVLTFHTGAAYQYILNRIIQHMAHVQNARNIWRRNDNGVRLTLIRNRPEKLVL